MKTFDITRAIHSNLPCFPGDKPFQKTEEIHKCFQTTCRSSHIQMSLHLGTHIDAPLHLNYRDFFPTQVDQIPLELLMGPCTVLDCVGLKSIDNKKIHQAAKLHPRILFKTSDRTDSFSMENFPHLLESAAQALLNRAPLLVGIDTPSVDAANSEELPVHHLLLSKGVLIVEGLDLSQIHEGDYELICLPLKLADAEASPVRAILRPLEN